MVRSVSRSLQCEEGVRLFGYSDINLTSSAFEGLPDEQKSSPVRRTFLLMVLFDFVMSFILWLIYIKVGSNQDFINALVREICNYKYTTSLFDVVCLALFRFIFLEIMYSGPCPLSRWYIAVSTAVTSLGVLVKCFCFDFHQSIKEMSNPTMSYPLLIYSVIMVWAETVFLEYRVLPQERIASQITTHLHNQDSSIVVEKDSPVLITNSGVHQWALNVAGSRYTASIYASPEASILGDNMHLLQCDSSDFHMAEAPVDMVNLYEEANCIRREAWFVYGHTIWSHGDSLNEKTPLLSNFSLLTAQISRYKHTVFRIEGLICASPRIIFNDIVNGVEQTPVWNSTVSSAKYVQRLYGEDIDIVYTASKEALKGLIKPRDFVLLRVWGEHSKVLYVASASVHHPSCPHIRSCVRAEQFINTIMLLPIGISNQTKFVCITSVDIKAWLPNRVYEQAIVGALNSFFEDLQRRAVSLCVNPNSVPGIGLEDSC